MLKINLLTGTAFTVAIKVEGDINSDLVRLLDEYYYEHGTLPVGMYTTGELDEYELETYIPINGGEYWIEGISSVEEVTL